MWVLCTAYWIFTYAQNHTEPPPRYRACLSLQKIPLALSTQYSLQEVLLIWRLSPCVSFACFWTAHAWTTRFEVLYVCLLLLNMMSVWFIHVVALLLVRSFIFIAGMYSIAWIDNNIFIGFLVGENLGCSSSWQMCTSSGGHTHVSWVYV